MSDAFELTPDKMAFIEQGSSGGENSLQAGGRIEPSANRRQTALSVSKSRPPESTKLESVANGVPSRAAFEVRKVEQTADARPLIGQHLVALTTRLQARTAEALRRAYLEQKLKQASPTTQQEIVETALRDWLGTNGYW